MLQWNCNLIPKLSIHGNASENIVCEIEPLWGWVGGGGGGGFVVCVCVWGGGGGGHVSLSNKWWWLLTWALSIELNTLRPRQDVRQLRDDIFKCIFSWKNIFEFRLQFHWSLFPRVQLPIFQQYADDDMAPSRRQVIIWTNDGLVNWRIYASLGLNELSEYGTEPYRWQLNIDSGNGLIPSN